MTEDDMDITQRIRKLTVSTFVFYIIILLWVTILKCNMEASIHGVRIFLEPMSIRDRFIYATSYFELDDSITSMLLNVFIFIPFGILVPLLRGKAAVLTTTAMAFLTTLAIESTQLIIAFGYFTYMDLICNTLGAALGIIIFAILRKLLSDDATIRALTVSNIFGVAASIFATIRTVMNIGIYL